MGNYAVRSLLSIARHRVTLFPGARYAIPNAAVYQNMSDYNAHFADHLGNHIYRDRMAQVDPIELVDLGVVTIHTANDFNVTVGQDAVAEQVPPSAAPEIGTVQIEDYASQGTVDAETMIIARYGIWTWGHWIGELLPKLVLVEATFPGRFRYAIPNTYAEPEWQTFRESIAAYGIGNERLVLLKENASCRLDRCWALTPVWSDHVLHPSVAEVMRARLPGGPVERDSRRIAIMRPASDGRSILNWPEVEEALRSHEFDCIDLSTLGFTEQVGLFRSAGKVFGVLGSGLMGLLYAPVGVGVVSTAPATFGDRFFYALVTDRRGVYADVRGATQDARNPDRSPFTVDLPRLEAALQAIR